MNREPKIAELPSGRFAYLELGRRNDPLVLCLHGFPDHARSFLPLARRLADAGYRVVAPWMRGYAPSTLAGPYHPQRLADDALELADHLGAARPALIGHDWGAVAAYRAALKAERLSCAVTMAVPHPLAFLTRLPRAPRQMRRSAYMFFFQLPHLPERALRRKNFALVRRLWRRWSPGYELPEAAWRELEACLAASLPAPIEYYRELRRPLASGSASFLSSAIRVPVLQLQGADDGCIAPSLCTGQDRWFGGPFSSAVVPEAGHFLHLEAPTAVSAEVLAWLDQHHPRAGAM